MRDVRYSIPGWIEAVSSDHEAHDLAYVLPHDSIAGFAVRHLTFRDLLRLYSIGCPFLRQFPSVEEYLSDPALKRAAAVTVAYLAIGYSERSRLRNMFRIWRVGRIDPTELYNGLRAYMERTFYDESSGSGSTSGDIRSLWSVAADVVDLFGREYGWTADYSLSLPYRQSLQSCRRIIRRLNPKAHIHTKSDDIIYDHLEKLNSGKAE